MDAASAALDSLFKKTPAPGTRDGTSVADTEGGQKTEQMADQAGQKLEEAGSEIKQKAGEASSAIGDKANEASSKAGTTGTTSGSASAVSGSTSTTSGATTDAPSVDKVTEETNTAETQEVAPAVEHDKITREHETRERDVVEKEVHKDHYHTTVQPLKDREVEDTEHKFEQAPTEYRETDKDDGAAKAQAEKNLSGFQDTVEEGKTKETEAKDETVMGEHVHHHMHEIIQPVIEKEVVKPSVTHVTNPIKETVHEQSEDHGVTKAPAMSVDDFKHNMDGESASKEKSYDGEPSA